MDVQLYLPNQAANQLQGIVNACIDNLKTYFSRIKTVEVFMTEEDDKKVEIKLYVLCRVLYTTDHADGFEKAFKSAAEKMRKLLVAYQKEVAII